MTDEGWRPYPPTGMSTERWKALPETEVDIKLLNPTQPQITWKQLVNAALGPDDPSLDPCPYVVMWNGVRYLEDGQHRVLVAALRGQRTMMCRVLNLNSWRDG